MSERMGDRRPARVAVLCELSLPQGLDPYPVTLGLRPDVEVGVCEAVGDDSGPAVSLLGEGPEVRRWSAHMRNTDMRVDHRDALAQSNLPAVMLHRKRDRDVIQSMPERLVNMDVFSMFPIAGHIQAHSFWLRDAMSPACRRYPDRDGLLVTGG